MIDRALEIELHHVFRGFAGRFAVRGETAQVEKRGIESGIFPIDPPEALAVDEQISGEHIVVAEDDVDRPDCLFETLRHPREGSQSGDMRTSKFAQGPVIVADDLKHPEQWRGPREVFGDLPVRALDQIDEARMIFGRANVLGLQGPPTTKPMTSGLESA